MTERHHATGQARHVIDHATGQARRVIESEAARLVATSTDSPVGRLTLVASAAGLRAVLWPDDDPHRTTVGDLDGIDRVDGERQTDDGDAPDPRMRILDDTVRQLTEYFDGERTAFDLPLDPDGTEFQRSAWDALGRIPYGCTASYGEQAEKMGDRRKARAVGSANGRNPLSIVVPCHRVVGADGSLTGFAGGTDAKRWLLDHEARVSGATLL